MIVREVRFHLQVFISAIGPIEQMLDSVGSDPYIDLYLQYVDEFSLGWQLQVDSALELPGYDGGTDLGYARALVPDAEDQGATG